MYKTFFLMTLFYSVTALASDDVETCLSVQRDGDVLTFFYSKQDEDDRPYFYVKALTSETTDGEDISLNDVEDISSHLFRVSKTRDKFKRYQTPDNTQKLYIVKSLSPLSHFSSARIVPTIATSNNKAVNIFVKAKRNASNSVRSLPKEKKKRNADVENASNDITVLRPKKKKSKSLFEDETVKICEFSLL